MPIVDCDTHVIENELVWDYIPKAQSHLKPLPGLIELPNGGQRKIWTIEGRQLARGGAKDTPEMTAAMRDLSDIPARLAHMDQLGVDVQVIYPSFFLTAVTRRPELELVLCQAWNRFMADVWAQSPDRLRWVMMPPLLSMDETVKEMAWAKDHGAVGVFLRGIEGERYLKDPYFFPMYAKGAELQLAMCVHAGNGNVDLAEIQQKSFFDMLVLPIVSGFQSVLVGELPQKFPGLKWGFFEAGSNWVPFVIQQSRKHQEIFDKVLLDDPVRNGGLYIACESDDDLAYVTQFTGPDNIVIGSDYGHTDTAAEVEALRNLRNRAPVGPQVIDRILSDNAVSLYAL